MCPIQTEHEPQGGEPMSAELSSHTSPFAPTATCCSCSLWFFVLLFPHDENCAFIFATPASVRLFSSCVSLVCVVRGCVAFCCEAATQTKWHNERTVPIYVSAVRSEATEERLLRSQSRLVVPRYAVAVGPSNRVQSGNDDMGATR